MTQLSDQDRKAQMADMKSFDEQMPCVGIFWYDMELATTPKCLVVVSLGMSTSS